MDARIVSELSLQKSVVTLLRFAAVPDLIWYAVPNGEFRSKKTGARLKASGVRPGVADIAVVLPGGISCFLELKTPIGRLSPKQKEFRALCEANGARYAVATSLLDARHTLAGWGALAHWKSVPEVARGDLTSQIAAAITQAITFYQEEELFWTDTRAGKEQP